MLELMAAIGGGLFVLSSLIVGGRIFLAGVRTRQRPELFIGGGLFLLGGIGYPMLATAQQATGLPPDVRAALIYGHMASNIIGLTAVTHFTQQIFRPGHLWARGFVWGVGIACAAAITLQVTGPGALAFAVDGTGSWHLDTHISLFVLLWSGFESLNHGLQMKKRLALGLADPAVTNRILLWGVAMLSAGIISLSTVVLAAIGVQIAGSPIIGLIVGPLGLVSSACLFLAFMPPAAYVRWMAARSEVQGG